MTAAELFELAGVDPAAYTRIPLGYSQTNGTERLRAAVAAKYPGTFGTLCVRIEMCHLLDGMYAGIGTARANELDRVIGNAGKCRFETTLNGALAFLVLPATVLCSGILDSKRNSHNGRME